MGSAGCAREILAEDLVDIGLTKNQLAKALHVAPNRITAIVDETRQNGC